VSFGSAGSEEEGEEKGRRERRDQIVTHDKINILFIYFFFCVLKSSLGFANWTTKDVGPVPTTTTTTTIPSRAIT
jgi:hypothetical protein